MMQTIVLDEAGRLGMIDMVLGMLRASDDPRAPEAIAEYERQRAVLVSATSVVADGQPPAQVVGMQTAELRGN